MNPMRANPFLKLPALVTAGLGGVAVGVLATAPVLLYLAKRAVLAEDRASRDPLTGIAHRHTARARFTRCHTARDLLLLDLNGFKGVNDMLGHDAGDQVIQAVASRLDVWARAHAVLAARLGGDEFLIIGHHHGRAAALATANELHQLLATPVAVTSGHQVVTVSPSASIGVSLPGHGRGWSARLRAADIALYHAKRSQPQVSVYAPGMSMPGTPAGLRLRDLPIHPGDA